MTSKPTRGGAKKKTASSEPAPAASSVKLGQDVLQILAERISSSEAFKELQARECAIAASGMFVVKGDRKSVV